jgi:ABC-type transporter Mla MlaB component
MAGNIKKKDKRKVIKTGTNLTIDNVPEMYRQLLNEIGKQDAVSLESDEIKHIDLTGIQFLHFAKQLSDSSDTNVSFILKFSPETTQLLAKIGFSYLLN